MYWSGLKYSVWVYLIRSGKFVLWAVSFDCFIGSTWRFCFTVRWFWRGTLQIPVWCYLRHFRIPIPFLVMLSLCSSKIYLNPPLHNFPIDMRELFERTEIKCASLTLSGNWYNCSVHAVSMVDFCCMLMKHKLYDLVCVKLRGGHLAWYMSQMILYPQVHIFCTVCCVGVTYSVDIMVHFYNIGLIGFP